VVNDIAVVVKSGFECEIAQGVKAAIRVVRGGCDGGYMQRGKFMLVDFYPYVAEKALTKDSGVVGNNQYQEDKAFHNYSQRLLL